MNKTVKSKQQMDTRRSDGISSGAASIVKENLSTCYYNSMDLSFNISSTLYQYFNDLT